MKSKKTSKSGTLRARANEKRRARGEKSGRPTVIGSLPDRIKRVNLRRLNEALAYLFQELSRAKALHQSGAKAGREGVIHSVETIVNFLSIFASVISSRLHVPLGVLFDALMNLDDGKVLPLLKPAKKTGRARASAMRGSLVGGAAFTVKRLADTGMHIRDAEKTVARVLNNLGVKSARGRTRTITGRTIRGWCEEVSADLGRDGEAAQTFDLLMNDPKGQVSDLSPTETRTILLDRLTTVARAIRAQEGA